MSNKTKVKNRIHSNYSKIVLLEGPEAWGGGGGPKPITPPIPPPPPHQSHFPAHFFSKSHFPVPKSHSQQQNSEKIAVLHIQPLFASQPQNYGLTQQRPKIHEDLQRRSEDERITLDSNKTWKWRVYSDQLLSLHTPVIPAWRKSAIRLVSVLTGFPVWSDGSCSLSLALKLSTCSLLGDSSTLVVNWHPTLNQVAHH